VLRSNALADGKKLNKSSGSVRDKKTVGGHPSPSKRQKLNATANAFGAPIRPRHLVPTQQGVGTLAPNDLMKFWNPCYRSENKKSSLLLRLCFYNFQQLNSYFLKANSRQ
jgi:hypothetical protein